VTCPYCGVSGLPAPCLDHWDCKSVSVRHGQCNAKLKMQDLDIAWRGIWQTKWQGWKMPDQCIFQPCDSGPVIFHQDRLAFSSIWSLLVRYFQVLQIKSSPFPVTFLLRSISPPLGRYQIMSFDIISTWWVLITCPELLLELPGQELNSRPLDRKSFV